MARDGYFLSALGNVHPRHRSPHVSILALSLWAVVLVLLSGNYEELFTYVIFASWILYGMSAASVFVLRRKKPDLPRPHRVVGYPVVPLFFVSMAAALVGMTLWNSPLESLKGLLLIVLGIPFYWIWRKSASFQRNRFEA
jgi:APA family basic amino acid/polyamine antiporter